MSISTRDTKVSMLYTLLLAKIRISYFYFLVLVMLSNFLVISVITEKIPAPAIPIGAPTTLTEEIIQTPPLVAKRAIEILSM